MKLQSFKGMLPRVAPELLPDGYAQLARNVKLHSGDLIPYRAPMPVPGAGGFTNAKTIYKTGAEWERSSIDTDIVNISTGMGAPVRTYRANGKTAPLVDGFPLGLPIPTQIPTITVSEIPEGAIAMYQFLGSVVRFIFADRDSRVGLSVGDNVLVSGLPDAFKVDTLRAVVDKVNNIGARPSFEVSFVETAGGEVPMPDGYVTLTGNANIRRYVYTWVTATGEESIPTAPFPADREAVVEGQYVDFTGMPTEPPTNRLDIRGYRVYRTVTSAGGTSYLRLDTRWFSTDDLPVEGAPYTVADPDGEYRDNIFVGDLSLALPSIDYDAPPTDLHGLREAHNNILVGFSGTELCFSLPNVPHAWPERHRLSLPSKITAVEPTQGAILVLTEDYPYVVSGNDPPTMTAIRLNTPYGCKYKRSVVVLDNGVMWVTDAGLALYQSGGGLRLATEASVAWDDWNDNWVGGDASAWYYEGNYLATTPKGSFIYYPGQQEGYFVGLSNTFDVGYYDNDDGEFYFVENGVLYKWDADPLANLDMEWVSKRFITPRFMNYGAAKLEHEGKHLCAVTAEDTTPGETGFATLTLNCSGETPNTGGGVLRGFVDVRTDGGIEPLWDGAFTVDNPGGTIEGTAVRVLDPKTNTHRWWIDNVVWDLSIERLRILLIHVNDGSDLDNPNPTQITFSFEGELTKPYPTYKMQRGVPPSQCCDVIVSNNKPFRLPAGFKDDTYDITITGRSRVRSVHVAETVSGLRGV
ncbi:MAG: hypothetical protein K0U66_04765 [Gammaproteobacteria bacterium]|nr:hypothetical protein [Gammaproteobacteria bacterium]